MTAPSSLRESLASRSLFGFLLQLVLRMRGLLLVPILTRALPPAELGVVSLGNALTSGLTPLLLLGMHTALALQVVQLQGPNVRPAVLTVLSFATVFSVTVTTLLLALVATGLFGPAVSPLLPVLLPVGVFAVALTLREVGFALPLARQELRFIGWNSLLMDLGGVVVAITAVLMGYGAYGALLGVGLLSLLGGLISAAFSIRIAEGPWTYDPSFLRATLRIGLPVVPLAFGLWTLQTSDYFFVAHYRGAAEVAVYGLAYSLASPTLMVMAAMNLTYLPTCVEILRQGRLPFALFMDTSTRLFTLGGIAAIAFAAAAGPGLTVWIAGPAYAEAGRLLPIVVGAYVFFSLSQLLQLVPGTMIQDMTGSARAHAWAAIVNVAANSFMVPKFGLWGASWSTLASYALAFLLLSRHVGGLLPELRWTRHANRFVGLTAIATGAALLMAPQATGALSAALMGIAAVLLTLAAAAALGLLSRHDLEHLPASLKPRHFKA